MSHDFESCDNCPPVSTCVHLCPLVNRCHTVVTVDKSGQSGQMSTLFNKLHLIAICEYNTSKKLVINPVLINFHKQGGQVWTNVHTV